MLNYKTREGDVKPISQKKIHQHRQKTKKAIKTLIFYLSFSLHSYLKLCKISELINMVNLLKINHNPHEKTTIGQGYLINLRNNETDKAKKTNKSYNHTSSI